MYSIKVPRDCETPLEYIRDELLNSSEWTGVTRAYLLEAATWESIYICSEDEDCDTKIWVAMSPIPMRTGDYWPLYDLDGVKFSSSTKLVFKSWKGDYEDEKIYWVSGNLPGVEKTHNFAGKIWTRGYIW